MKKSILFAALLTFAFGATAMAAPKSPVTTQKATSSVCKGDHKDCKGTKAASCKECKESKAATTSCKGDHKDCKEHKAAPAAAKAPKAGHENCTHH